MPQMPDSLIATAPDGCGNTRKRTPSVSSVQGTLRSRFSPNAAATRRPQRTTTSWAHMGPNMGSHGHLTATFAKGQFQVQLGTDPKWRVDTIRFQNIPQQTLNLSTLLIPFVYAIAQHAGLSGLARTPHSISFQSTKTSQAGCHKSCCGQRETMTITAVLPISSAPQVI